MSSELSFYSGLFGDIKTRIQTAQVRAILSVNAELVRLYWDIGQLIDARQQQQGWGAAIIPHLSRDLHNELPEIKGFSERNIKRMLAFYRAYPDPEEIMPQAVAQITADYSLRGIDKPIGISDYELLRALPETLQSSLPSIEEIEAELGVEAGREGV